MIATLRSLHRQRHLLADFVVRDLKARYVGSAMGFFWSIVFPIVNLFVFMFVFRLLLKARWGESGGETDTALIMLAGILVWTAFAETVGRATNCLVENANLIQKVVFPSEILPVYLTISSLINMLIGLPIVLIGCMVFGVSWPGWWYVYIPLLLLLQILFTVGLGYLLATLNLFLRDTYHLVGVALQVWMFATPIFYPAEMVRNTRIMLPHWLSFLSNGPLGVWEKGENKGEPVVLTAEDGGFFYLDWMLDYNPMHWLIQAWRDVTIFERAPDSMMLLKLAIVGIVLFWLGSVFFRRHQYQFPDLL